MPSLICFRGPRGTDKNININDSDDDDDDD